MILYTEKQLEEAWILHCSDIVLYNAESKFKVEVPSMEQFRPIYEKVLKFIMANDRVSRETAELVPFRHTWYVRTVGWLLEQEKYKRI